MGIACALCAVCGLGSVDEWMHHLVMDKAMATVVYCTKEWNQEWSSPRNEATSHSILTSEGVV